jgi:hypothetical protein
LVFIVVTKVTEIVPTTTLGAVTNIVLLSDFIETLTADIFVTESASHFALFVLCPTPVRIPNRDSEGIETALALVRTTDMEG